MKEPPVQLDLPDNPWLELRRLTPARIALGRTGTSLPTSAQLTSSLPTPRRGTRCTCRSTMRA